MTTQNLWPPRKGDTVEAEDDPIRCGLVVAELESSYVSVKWHNGDLRDEHITDLRVHKRPDES